MSVQEKVDQLFQKNTKKVNITHTIRITYHFPTCVENHVESVTVCIPTLAFSSHGVVWIRPVFQENKTVDHFFSSYTLVDLIPRWVYMFDENDRDTCEDILKKIVDMATNLTKSLIVVEHITEPLNDHCVDRALGMIESMIQVLPGAYRNQGWRPLDGFFGMYFEEKTGQFSKYPPHL